MSDKFDSIDKSKAAVFDPVSLGASFQELAVDIVETDELAFISRWFRSSHSDADLLIWCDGEGRVLKHQLSFFGQVVEWNALEGTRTGMIVEEEMQTGGLLEHKLGYDSDESGESEDMSMLEMVVFDKDPQTAAIGQAIALIESVNALKTVERSTLAGHLKYSTKLKSTARERALEAWSSIWPELDKPERPRFWRRLKNWFKTG